MLFFMIKGTNLIGGMMMELLGISLKTEKNSLVKLLMAMAKCNFSMENMQIDI